MKNVSYCLVALGVVGMALGGYGQDQEELLKTETGFVAELLSLSKPALAQKHLDIIKKEFPTQEKDIWYYQGHISFRTRKYRGAVESFERLLALKPTPARKAEAKKLLSLSYIRTAKFDKANALMATIKAYGGKDSWYARACVELAETQAEAVAGYPAKKRLLLKAATVKTLATFAEKFPKNDQIPWIRFFSAEYEYDRLVAFLYELGKIKDEASPDVLEQKTRAIIIQLHKARRIYDGITQATPDHAVIKRVTPRQRVLAKIIAKLKKGESFLPEDL